MMLGENMKNYLNPIRNMMMGTASVVALAAMAGMASGLNENTEPIAWTTTRTLGDFTVSAVPGSPARVIVSFPQQDPDSPPSAGLVYLVTGGDPQASPFAGDYVDAHIKNIAFKIGTSAVGNPVRVVLKSTAFSTEWKHGVSVPQTADGWVTNAIPLEWDGLWYRKNPGDGNAADWASALRSVNYVGIAVDRTGQASQTITVDSFILAGVGFVTPPAMLLAFGDALEARFGVRNYSDLTAAQKALDTDKDGMTDVDEILAGTNPDNKNSVFAANVVKTTAEGVTIRWSCVNGGVYTLSRTSDLVGSAFAALPAGYRLTATQDGYMEFTDKTVKANAGPYFYRIVKE